MANNLDELENFADRVREAWKLGINPIGDLTDTLEALGLLVIVVDEDNPGFSGLKATALSSDGRSYPIIAVSSQWPGDRQRFTLAHELGHLLLSGHLAVGINEEKACDRFASAFLAPKVAVLQSLGESRRSDFLIRMRISSQILEIDLALYFGKIGKPHRKNFHF